MKKNFFQRGGVAVAVAVIFFVVVSGDVQAIPITLSDFRLAQPARSHLPNQRLEIPGTAVDSLVSAPIQKQKTAVSRNAYLANSHRRNPVAIPNSPPVAPQGSLPTTVLNTPISIPGLVVVIPQAPRRIPSGNTGAAQGAVGVPDGGSAAILLSGSLFALALLGRRIEFGINARILVPMGSNLRRPVPS